MRDRPVFGIVLQFYRPAAADLEKIFVRKAIKQDHKVILVLVKSRKNNSVAARKIH